MIFGGDKSKTDQPKRRSVVVEAFNPHIGDTIRPVGQSFNLIVNLIAMIFVSQGLFPRNHPALSGEAGAPRLRLQDVFATAWSNLSFTKEGLPKVLMFFAVIASVIISVFGVFSVLLSLMMGTAHAQGATCPAQGCFTPANTTNDLGYNLINFLFGSAADQTTAYDNINNNVYVPFAGIGSMPNNNIQTALAQGLALYSAAMLIFAAIILFYHLAAMVVDTAHSGVTMGKRANQVWAPIRLVAAVILLVPISGGLNSGQMIVLKMAQWGSGLASNVWDVFKVQLTAGTNGNYAAPAVPDVSSTVINVANIAACEYKYNYDLFQNFNADPTLANSVAGVNPNPDSFVNGWTNNWNAGAVWNFNADPQLANNAATLTYQAGVNTPLIESVPNGTIYHFQPAAYVVTSHDICGSITIPAPPNETDPTQNQMTTAVYNADLQAFNAVLPSILHYAINEQQYIQGSGNTAIQGNINPDLSGTSIMTIIANFQSNLNLTVGAQVAAQAGMTDKYLGVGWMGAGAFFNQTSNVQAAIQAASDQFVPAVSPPSGGVDLVDFNADLKDSIQKQNIASLPPVSLPGGGGCAAGAANNWSTGFEDIIKKSTGSIFDMLLDILNLAASHTGVWCGDGTIGVRFTGTAPLSQMAAWGHANIDLAVNTIDTAGWLMAAGYSASGSAIGRLLTGVASIGAAVGSYLGFHKNEQTGSQQSKDIFQNLAVASAANAIAFINPGLASVIGEFLLPFAALFLTIGFMFGYMLPILPFMHFLFGCVTWLTVLFEAVIAMPLVALAHINPEGEGLPGQYAREAYFMAFSILLRPVLMIFGLICGFITLMLATSILNIFFAHAMTGNTTQSHQTLIKIIYTIIYATILVSIANHAFRLISLIPDKIMSWINARGAKGEQMGDPNQIVDRSAAAAAIIDSQGVRQLARVGSAIRGRVQAGNQAAAAGAAESRALGAQGFAVNQSGGITPTGGGIMGQLGRIAGNTAGYEDRSAPPPSSPPPSASNIPEPSSGAGGSPVSQSTNVGAALRDRDAGGGSSGGGNTGGGSGLILPS